MIQHSQVRVVVESEDSAFKPTIVCGKFLTSALATHLRHKGLLGEEALLLGVLFIRVMKTGHLTANFRKRKQDQTIETAMQNCVRDTGSQVVAKRIFGADSEDNDTARERIAKAVKDHFAAELDATPHPTPNR